MNSFNKSNFWILIPILKYNAQASYEIPIWNLIKLSINNLCALKDTNCKTSTQQLIYMYEKSIPIEVDTYIYEKQNMSIYNKSYIDINWKSPMIPIEK